MVLSTCLTEDSCTQTPCLVQLSRQVHFCSTDGTCSSWWWSGIKSKGTLETHLCSPPKQCLCTTEMKAVDNRGIPSTHSLVGSWRLTQVGVEHYPPFEGGCWRACYLSGISSVPWASELLLRSDQVVNTCLAFQKSTHDCQTPTRVQRQPGRVAGLCDMWPFEGPPWFLFCSEAKLDCWAAGLSTSSLDLEGREAGESRAKVHKREASIKWVCHSPSKHHFV